MVAKVGPKFKFKCVSYMIACGYFSTSTNFDYTHYLHPTGAKRPCIFRSSTNSCRIILILGIFDAVHQTSRNHKAVFFYFSFYSTILLRIHVGPVNNLYNCYSRKPHSKSTLYRLLVTRIYILLLAQFRAFAFLNK